MKVLLPTKFAPLYNEYPGQCNGQTAYLEIDSESCTADWNAEIGNGVPQSVWDGRTRRYHIPNDLSAEGLAAFVEDNLPLIERISAGMRERWNGNNMVGTLNHDGQLAELDLDRAVEEMYHLGYDSVQIYSAFDWFETEAPPAGQTYEEIEADAQSENVLFTDLEHYLDELSRDRADEGHGFSLATNSPSA